MERWRVGTRAENVRVFSGREKSDHMCVRVNFSICVPLLFILSNPSLTVAVLNRFMILRDANTHRDTNQRTRRYRALCVRT